MRAKTFTPLLVFCLFALPGWAQESGSGNSGGGGDSGGGQGSSNSGSGRSQSRSRRDPQFQRPIFISGQVVLDDGSAPNEQVAVDLVCQGAALRQVHTSGGGIFSFQLSTGRGSQDALQPIDASVSSSQYGDPFSSSLGGANSGPFGSDMSLARTDSLNLSACELIAELPGFQSDRIALGLRRALDNPDVGLLVLHRTVIPASGTVSIKTLAAPKEATKAFEKAGKELRKKKSNLSKATTELKRAVEIYPEFAAAWQLLGEVRLRQQALAAGRDAFEQALAADSQFALPLLSLAAINLDEQRWEEVIERSNRALEINPRLARAHYFKALAESSLGNLNEAEEAALWVQNSSSSEDYPATHYILGWVQSRKGNFEAAVAEYREFIEIQPAAAVGKELREQIDQWEVLGLIATAEIPDSEK
jgi:Flp pilus assembly protein TadD